MPGTTTTDESFHTDVLRAPGLVLVEFTAEWCAPCRLVAPVVQELATHFAGRLTVLTLDTEENPQVTTEAEVTQIPTLKLYRGGSEVHQIVGARPKPELIDLIEPHLPALID